MSEYAIHQYESDSFDAYSSEVSQYSGSLADFRRKWWCFDNPFGGVFAAAFYGPEVAATCYLAGRRLGHAEGHVVAYEIGETWTAEKHRRKGLFSQLVKHCVGYATEKGADVVFGTPNAQSAPGYQKLDFHVIHDAASFLVFAPIATRVVLRALNSRSTSSARPTLPWVEVDAEEHISETKAFPRMNECDPLYLTWRFSGPVGYRFFHARYPEGVWRVVARETTLGNYPVMTCSEYFLDRAKPSGLLVFQRLRQLARSAFRGVVGAYARGLGTDNRWSIPFVSRGLLTHRVLPVCFYPISTRGEEAVRTLLPAFQLSDCDIG